MSMTFVVLLVILVAVMAALIFAVADYNRTGVAAQPF